MCALKGLLCESKCSSENVRMMEEHGCMGCGGIRTQGHRVKGVNVRLGGGLHPMLTGHMNSCKLEFHKQTKHFLTNTREVGRKAPLSPGEQSHSQLLPGCFS